jgi:NADP-dependent 3-hydroxy acid dehydrogenase YdfG
MHIELKNKLAIVTGVSKGIGHATVTMMLQAGIKVAGWGRTDGVFNDANYLFVPTDVAKQEEVARAHAQTIAHFGQSPDILINNAGLGYQGLLHQMPVEEWQLMFDVNVHGIFFCSRLVVEDMMRKGYGHIINISSIAGTTGIETMAGYCGTKYAVRGISHSLYKEVRDYGVKVSCIYPGSVKTNFFDTIPSVTTNDNMMMPEDIASTIMHCLQSSPNYHHVDIEVRPLMPKGRKSYGG